MKRTWGIFEMMSNKFIKFTVLTFLFLFWFQNLSADWVDNQLKHLSLGERASLRHFFGTVIKEDHLGHVLFFSNKPACFGGGFIKGERSLDKKLFMKGWRVWKAKEHLFPHSDYIIHDEVVDFGGENVALHIYFINKKTLLETLMRQEEKLREGLGKDFSKEVFVRNLEQGNLFPLIDADQALLGILLGYGVESSVAFRQNDEAKQKKGDLIHPVEVIFCTSKKEFLVHPVTFMGNPESDEVKSLQEKYGQELEKINEIYLRRDLLKISLQALCGVQPND